MSKIYETATVMAVHRERYELLVENQKIYGRLKTVNFYNTGAPVEFPTVGDRAEISYNESGDSLIIKVRPRKSVFMRQNSTQGLPDQAVAANFDFVFITMSLNRDFHISKLERYLTVAWQSGGTPIIVLTKADLCEDTSIYLSVMWSRDLKILLKILKNWQDVVNLRIVTIEVNRAVPSVQHLRMEHSRKKGGKPIRRCSGKKPFPRKESKS